MIKLVASDLDGTIIDTHNSIYKDNFKAISDINKHNIPFVVCTGKTYSIYKGLCSSFHASYGIFGNGTSIINLKTGEEIYQSLYSVELKCVPFDTILIDDIVKGKVLLVSDKKGNLAPYVNPIQTDFEMIIEEERKRNLEKQNSFQTFEEYTDEIDNVALDKNISNNKIKTLSKKRYDRKGK